MLVAILKKMCKQREHFSMDAADSPSKNTCKRNCPLKKQTDSSFRRRNTLESRRPSMSETDFNRLILQLRTFRQFFIFFLYSFLHKARNVSKQIKFYLVFFSLVFDSVSALPKLCSEPRPIDLLAEALSNSINIPTGVEVVSDVDDVKGYRFDPSARLLGVASGDIFPLCNRFPFEFSIVLTFQHHAKRKTNQFIMTLLAQDRRTVLVALRLQRNRLFLDFVTPAVSSKISSSFKNDVLSDGTWHTVVVTVSSSYVTFTLDCGLPQKRIEQAQDMIVKCLFQEYNSLVIAKFERATIIATKIGAPNHSTTFLHRRNIGRQEFESLAGLTKTSVLCFPTQLAKKLQTEFPKNLNIRNTKIHIASRRSKRRRYTGLMRQLVLLPGADAATKICPSSNPSLANLNDKLNAASAASTMPSLIFEDELESQTCSSVNKGALKYTSEMKMQVCNGKTFKDVRGGHERLDYVVDFEDIVTDSYSVAIENFVIPGEGTFLATANNDDLRKNESHIFKWDGKRFVRYQEVKTYSATMWKFFQIDSEYFLAVANSGNYGDAQANSVIYRWSFKKKKFKEHQILPTSKCRSIEYFSIDDDDFIFAANQLELSDTSNTQHPGPSMIYRWDPDSRKFAFHQWIKTLGAADVTFFRISLNPKVVFSCLVVANSFNGETSHVESVIYCWQYSSKNQLFEEIQRIRTVGAVDWEFFHFEDRYFLAVANSFDQISQLQPTRFLNSSIYELNVRIAQFLLYQEIETYGANDWEYFQIGKQHFLLVANTNSSTSELYRWQGIEKFVKVHSFPVGVCSDFDHMLINGEHYIAYANPIGKLSKLYEIITY